MLNGRQWCKSLTTKSYTEMSGFESFFSTCCTLDSDSINNNNLDILNNVPVFRNSYFQIRQFPVAIRFSDPTRSLLSNRDRVLSNRSSSALVAQTSIMVHGLSILVFHDGFQTVLRYEDCFVEFAYV